MMKRILLAAAVALAATPAAWATTAPTDGFAAFYKTFAAAAAKDDQKTLAALTVLGPGLGGDHGPLTFAEIHKTYLTAGKRACLAKAKPKGGKDGNGAPEYAAFCGQLIYVFTKTPAGWRWTDLSPDD